jgi:hypothetical protein
VPTGTAGSSCPFADGHPPKRMGMEDTQRVYPKDPDPLPWPENHFDRGNW